MNDENKLRQKTLVRIFYSKLKYLLLFVIIVWLRMFIHEGGYLITALMMSGKILVFAIMPVIQLYPEMKLIYWDGWGAIVDYNLTAGTPFKSGMIALSGSLSTAILGYLLIIYAIRRRPAGWQLVAILMLALLSIWDIIVTFRLKCWKQVRIYIWPQHIYRKYT